MTRTAWSLLALKECSDWALNVMDLMSILICKCCCVSEYYSVALCVMAWCSAKRHEMMHMGRSGDELKDSCVFICCKTDNQVADVAQRGIEVKASSASSLGKCCLYTWCSVQSLKYAVTAYAKKFAFHIKIISLLHCSRPAKTLNSTLVSFSWHFFFQMRHWLTTVWGLPLFILIFAHWRHLANTMDSPLWQLWCDL